MALTAQDKAFLDKQKAKGLPFEEAWAKLSAVKKKLGLTGGTFATRAASFAESATPRATESTLGKAEVVKNQGEDFGKVEPAPTQKIISLEGGLSVNPGAPIQNFVNSGGKNILEGAKESAEGALGLAKDYLPAVQPGLNLVPGFGPEQETEPGGQDLRKTFSGAIKAVSAPLTSIIQSLPGGEQAATVLNPSTYTTWLFEKAAESAGVDTSSPEYKEALEQIRTATDIGTIIAGPKVAEVTKPGFNWLGKKLKGGGKTLAESVLPTTEREATALQDFDAGITSERPRTVGDTAMERDIAGRQKTIGTKSTKEKSAIFKEEIEPALKNSTEKIVKSDIFKKLEEVVSRTEEEGRKKVLQEGLEAIKEDYQSRSDFTLSQAQDIKSGLDKFTPSKIWKKKEVADGYNQMRSYMANLIREEIYNKLSSAEIKTKYIDYSNLLELEKLGIKSRMEKGAGFRPGGTGTLIREIWDMGAIPIGTRSGQIIYKVGDLFEFQSPEKVKTVGEFIQLQGLTRDDFEEQFN